MFLDFIETILFLFGSWLFIIFYTLALPDTFKFLLHPSVRESNIKLDLTLWVVKNITFKAAISSGFILICWLIFETQLWFWIYSSPWILFFIATSINTADDIYRKNFIIRIKSR